jgi:hypothetical protein
MTKRKLLNVRAVLEVNVELGKNLHLFEGVPPLLVEAIKEQAFISRAILRKHENTRKDVRVESK